MTPESEGERERERDRDRDRERERDRDRRDKERNRDDEKERNRHRSQSKHKSPRKPTNKDTVCNLSNYLNEMIYFIFNTQPWNFMLFVKMIYDKIIFPRISVKCNFFH